MCVCVCVFRVFCVFFLCVGVLCVWVFLYFSCCFSCVGFFGRGGGVFPVVGGFFGWLRFFCVFCFSLFVCLFFIRKEEGRKCFI